MGVPALFRWLSTKYPKIISPVVEETADVEYGKVPQYSDPNPNGELDNLYLDMNGIVHPCSHPENKPAPETEDEMFLDVFKYTDRVLMMARPRKVLVIAVDGVAPRAKMNQQRARRFRAAQEAKIANDEKERQILESEARGESIDASIKDKRKWDTNAITPGTPFMDGLAAALRYWVAYKLASDPGWKDLQVIISDATVPGEGEHKLMSFIRSQRSDPEYDPNTKHCIYGLDADLIFLGLATHEPHFRVLREDVFAQGNSRMGGSAQFRMSAEQKKLLQERDARKPFLWLHVNVLREYLEVELKQNTSFAWDLERAIDDWVFMCFFVGNDFLPHMPALSVRDNGIDILVGCWKQVITKLRDYITCDGKLNLEGVEQLLAVLSNKEGDIFKKRRENDLRYQNNRKRRFAETEEQTMKKQYMSTVSKGKEKAPLTADLNMPLMDTSGKMVEGYAQLSNKDIVHNRDIITKANMANADAAAALKKLLDGSSAEEGKIKQEQATVKEEQPAKPKEKEDSDSDIEGDNVRTWESGYRSRYYKNKFHVETEEEMNQVRKDVARCYLEGISWVLLYYYQGCPSWQWYYPYHYAPFAADFIDIREVIGEQGISFELGEPFRPYEQLMAVLPAASGHTLPEVFRGLMSDPDSEIIDFYPEDFQIDMNGAKMSWQGIALLPFIDQSRLLTAVQAKYPLLTDAETQRNTNKSAQLYISSQNKNYQRFRKQFDDDKEVSFKSSVSGLAGVVKPTNEFSTDGEFIFPLKEGDLPHVKNSAFLPSWYEFPKTTLGKSMLLNGYISHNKVLDDMDAYSVTNKQKYNPRFQNTSDYVNEGPAGNKDYMTFSMRPGGYRAMIEGGSASKQRSKNGNGSQQNHFQNTGGHNHGQYGQSYNYNNSYNGGNAYNNSYNNGGYNNNGYNNGGYNNNGYNNNAGYNNNGYNNNGYNNNGYNNNGHSNNGYNGNNRQHGGQQNYQRNHYQSKGQYNQGPRQNYRPPPRR
ncbi:hypothetical protein JCM33374_g4247 [Metschnikowia sp. JCM 33374]|nr:hypothetical protein JCM33374_g4247 [Metschnikowia sp. JCM 33374]